MTSHSAEQREEGREVRAERQEPEELSNRKASPESLPVTAATLTPNPSPRRRGEPEDDSGHLLSAISHPPPKD